MKNFLKSFPLIVFLIKKILSIYKKILSKYKWKKLESNKKIKIELGSGNKYGTNGWTTVDIGKADIIWDLRWGIPLGDNSVDIIYSSHLLEHLSYEKLLLLLKECYRILKYNGEFSVCVPNFKFYIDAYTKNQLFIDKKYWYQPALVDTNSAIDQLNYMAYMNDEHKYMFDEENLINTLKKSGFSEVKLRSFDSKIDLIERDAQSIYAKATKLGKI